jgi:hypothetical protein
MPVMGHGVDLLLVEREPDREDWLERSQPRDGAIVEPATVAQPVASRVECEQRDQEDVGLLHGCGP